MIKNDNIKPINDNLFFHHCCMFFIWIIVLYSNIIQYKYLEISHGMAILGSVVLFFFILTINGKDFVFNSLFSTECLWTLIFMGYMLLFGVVTSPRINLHLSQWIRSLEYIFIMMVIVSLIKETGTDSFHYLLLVCTLITALILLIDPVEYTVGRYSISVDLNPNGLGMTFVAGIWAALYLQQKKRISFLFVTGSIIIFLICIINTGSRKSLIASGIVILLWIILCVAPRNRNSSFRENLLVLLFIVFLIIILQFIYSHVYLDSNIARRMGLLKAEVTEGERFQLYKYGWELFINNPIFGIGFSGYYFFNGQYSHATFVEVPVSGGIIGTILYFSSYCISVIKCLHILVNKENIDNNYEDYNEIKMLIILWTVMVFFCSCVIHPYQFLSSIIFGILFGKIDFLYNRINDKTQTISNKESGSLYYGSTYFKM